MSEIEKIKHRKPVSIRHYTQTTRRIEFMSGNNVEALNDWLRERCKMGRLMKKRKRIKK